MGEIMELKDYVLLIQVLVLGFQIGVMLCTWAFKKHD